MNLKVAIFEDDKLLREMLYQLINGTTGFTCTGAFPDAENILHKIELAEPDVILMDIHMPGISGIDAVILIKKKFPGVQILMQTVFDDDEKIFEAICAGASGYLLKNTPPAKLLDALQEVYTGGSPMSATVARKMLEGIQKNVSFQKENNFNLSKREIEVLQNLVKGLSYKMIADTCGITIDTIKFHVKNIYEKLHVNSKSEAIVKAFRNKIV